MGGVVIAGVPAEERDRVACGVTQIPYVVQPDRVEIPCGGCGMRILVGPRVLALMGETGRKAFCPKCLLTAYGPGSLDVVSLGGT
jgi:hypothetical protein